MYDGAAATTILKIIEQKSHPRRSHGIFRHLVLEDGLVKGLGPVKITDRDLKPIDGVGIHESQGMRFFFDF